MTDALPPHPAPRSERLTRPDAPSSHSFVHHSKPAGLPAATVASGDVVQATRHSLTRPATLAPVPPLLAQDRADARSLISPTVVSGALRLIEFVVLAALGLAISLLYVEEASGSLHAVYMFAAVLGAGVATFAFSALGLYHVPMLYSGFTQFTRLMMGWACTLAFLIVIAFLLKFSAEFSRVWLTSWFFTGMAAVFAIRFAANTRTRAWARDDRLNRRAVLIGGGVNAENLIKSLEASGETDLRIVGVFDDRNQKRTGGDILGYPILGSVDELVRVARNSRVDMLIVTLPMSAENRLLEILKKIWVLPVDIRLSAHTSRLKFRPRTYSYLGDAAMFDMVDKPITDWNKIMKGAFDRTVGALALILLSPLMLLTALAIKLESRGPVFFKQKRFGFNNELIEVYKFRSMHTDMSDANAAKLVTKDDPRVTRVGRFIRKTSIDELPQLFNVLRGNLSLVGPRPHATEAKAANALYQDVVDGYYARHKVKPGITGWAQVNGWRGETDTEEKIRKRVEYDLHYIDNWSIFFDIYILARTPISLLKTENAY